MGRSRAQRRALTNKYIDKRVSIIRTWFFYIYGGVIVANSREKNPHYFNKYNLTYTNPHTDYFRDHRYRQKRAKHNVKAKNEMYNDIFNEIE